MNFKYSAIGDNIKENREHLEKLGYKFINLSNDGNFIFSSKNGGAYYANGNGWHHINCIDNPSLFQAVTAIENVYDINQWFTDGEKWFICKYDFISQYLDHHVLESELKPYHKASLAELQEHFKIE